MWKTGEQDLFFEALINVRKHETSFHTPGHGFGKTLKDTIFEHLEIFYQVDTSISSWYVGDPYKPNDGIVGKLKEKCAKYYGVPHTIFSVNGTSGLNILAVNALAGPGDGVLIDRVYAHSSTVAGIVISGARPWYLLPDFYERGDFYFGPTPEQIENALSQIESIKLVFLTSPTYNGLSTDLKGIASVCKSHGATLVVDQAHGAHFHFHEEMPLAAEDSDADVVNMSAHKTLPALSQSSWMHVLAPENIPILYQTANSLNLFSTSPNYSLIASLEVAVEFMHQYGKKRIDELLDLSSSIRGEINKLSNIFLVVPDRVPYDPLRITINTSNLRMSGISARKWLANHYGIIAERGSFQHVLFLIHFGTTPEDSKKLIIALRELDKHVGDESLILSALPHTPEPALTPRDAFYHKKKKYVSLDDAVDSIVGETVMAYQPSTPIIIAGETMTRDIAEYLKQLVSLGCKLKGPKYPDLREISIIES